MDRKRTGMSLEMVVEEEDYFFHSSSSSSSSDSEDDHDWLDSAFMGSFWVKDPNEERDRERWMASKLGIQCIARRLEKEARHTVRARVRAEKKEARKRQRLAHLQRIEEDKRREQQQQQQLLILQASLMEESLRPPLMVSEILKARRRRKSEGGYGDQRVVTHSPVYGLMDGGSRIGESGRALFLKPRSLSINEYSDDSSANDESDGDLSVPVPAPLSNRRVTVDVDDEESDESNNSDSGSLGEEGRTLSFDTLDSTPEVRPGAAFKLEFKRRWSLNFATTVQAVNPPLLDSSNLSSPTSPAISPSSATTSPLTTPTSPTPSSPSSLSPAPSPLSSGSQSPSSFRYLSWVREGGSLILNRDKGKRERRGTTLDGDKKAATEWRKRTREKAAEGESAQWLRPDAAGRLRSCTVSAAAGSTGDLQVVADEAKKRSVSVGNKSDALRVEPPNKSKGKRADNKSEVMFDKAPSSEDTTSTSTSTSTSTPTSSTTTSTPTSTPTSGPSAEMTSSTSSFDRIKRQLSGGLDKRRRGIMLSRSRSLTDRNRGSLEGYYANETVIAEAGGPDTQAQSDSYPSVTIVQLQGSENGGKGGSKPGSPVQPRSKTVTKELRTSKSCRNYRAAVGLSGLSTSGGLLTNGSSSSSGPMGSDEPADAAQQRKLEKERRKEEKQREKAERKEREREREREKEQQKELLRRSRRATDVSAPSPAASPRSFMSRLSGVPG